MATNLFCPACGTRNSTDQSFCRSCGHNLQKAAESLIEQMPGSERSGDAGTAALEKFGLFAFTGLGIAVSAGIIALIYIILTRMVISGANPIVGILLATFVLFAGLALAYVAWREAVEDNQRRIGRPKRPAESVAGARAEAGGLQSEQPLRLDDMRFEPVPSVVEGTTRRLKKTKDLTRKS